MLKWAPPVGVPEVFAQLCNGSDGIPEVINESEQKWKITPQGQPAEEPKTPNTEEPQSPKAKRDAEMLICDYNIKID
jgi:hypothetical protein